MVIGIGYRLQSATAILLFLFSHFLQPSFSHESLNARRQFEVAASTTKPTKPEASIPKTYYCTLSYIGKALPLFTNLLLTHDAASDILFSFSFEPAETNETIDWAPKRIGRLGR
ncbi:hypothetical protein HDK90DRAFT_492053 [Phyllosticta capitalensis]|uniref:Secreted protein n=1 Tax=Phyllosticta capitalensis TaxID=121624 RepID=A0ABR1YK28_9PEZI